MTEWLDTGLTDVQIGWMKDSAISPDIAVRAGLHSIDDPKAATKLFGWTPKQWADRRLPVLVFPYRLPFMRDAVVMRGKPATPLEQSKSDGSVSLLKYVQAKNTGVHLYFGPSLLEGDALRDASRPLFITEGERKVLSAESAGYPCIGLPGVSQWHRKGERELHPYFAHIALEERVVYLCFDGDALKNKDVRREELAFGRALEAAGAKVYIVRFPQDAEKLDDFLATRERTEFEGLLADAREHGQLPPDTRGASDADWAALWPKFRLDSKTDKPIKDVDTITAILREHPAWEGVLAFDSRFERQVLRKNPPFPAELGSKKAPRPFADVDATRIAMWLVSQRVLGWTSTPTIATIEAAVAAVCEANRYDPVAEYLTRLVWDKTPRLDDGPAKYFGAPDTDYHRAVFSKWMLSAVARVRTPGCKVDYVLVLEGGQGKGKSTALQVLASEPYFSDTMPEIGTKEAYEHCVGPWIIELAELSHMNRGDVEQIKAFVTARKPAFRHSYARRTTEHPRRCVFAGTTNKEHYLVDPTGDRRFWPLPCLKVDLEALAADRDQLWAEAVYRVRAGESWHLNNAALEAAATEEQSARRLGDPWAEDVAALVARSPWVTITEVLSHLKIDVARQDQRAANRAAAVLQSLGCRRRIRTIEGVRRWVYEGANTGSPYSTGSKPDRSNVLQFPRLDPVDPVDPVDQTNLSRDYSDNSDSHVPTRDPARVSGASQDRGGNTGSLDQALDITQDPNWISEGGRSSVEDYESDSDADDGWDV